MDRSGNHGWRTQRAGRPVVAGDEPRDDACRDFTGDRSAAAPIDSNPKG